MEWDNAEYLIFLIRENYKDMNDNDYEEIKGRIEKIQKDKIDAIFKRALGK